MWAQAGGTRGEIEQRETLRSGPKGGVPEDEAVLCSEPEEDGAVRVGAHWHGAQLSRPGIPNEIVCELLQPPEAERAQYLRLRRRIVGLSAGCGPSRQRSLRAAERTRHATCSQCGTPGRSALAHPLQRGEVEPAAGASEWVLALGPLCVERRQALDEDLLPDDVRIRLRRESALLLVRRSWSAERKNETEEPPWKLVRRRRQQRGLEPLGRERRLPQRRPERPREVEHLRQRWRAAQLERGRPAGGPHDRPFGAARCSRNGRARRCGDAALRRSLLRPSILRRRAPLACPRPAGGEAGSPPSS